jgi:UDP-N-acetylglucosamine--N-acetylmuramyl-(pentapeptide) pyrophosphoryl-undecaprenol N-acetylglucosamine transferase
MLHLNENKPILLVWGVTLGAPTLNHSIHRSLPDLVKHFQIVHLRGPNKLPLSMQHITAINRLNN